MQSNAHERHGSKLTESNVVSSVPIHYCCSTWFVFFRRIVHITTQHPDFLFPSDALPSFLFLFLLSLQQQQQRRRQQQHQQRSNNYNYDYDTHWWLAISSAKQVNISSTFTPPLALVSKYRSLLLKHGDQNKILATTTGQAFVAIERAIDRFIHSRISIYVCRITCLQIAEPFVWLLFSCLQGRFCCQRATLECFRKCSF